MKKRTWLSTAAGCLALILVLAGLTASGARAEGMVVQDSSGIRDDISDAVLDEDGGLTVVSGQYGIDIEESPSRAPITGDDWTRLLEGVAEKNGAETPTVYTDPRTGERTLVEVRYMGIGRSMVELNGEAVLVNTVDLSWETEAPEDHVLAVIRAPRNGYAWLRRDPGNSIKNPKLCQVRTDSVVRVIATGKNWTLVDYDGMRAYIQTSALEFFYNDHVEFESGVISINGKTTGKATVHARSRDNGRRDLGEYQVGTALTVFDIIDEWAEVDVCGWHCRIESKYVTLEGENIASR